MQRFRHALACLDAVNGVGAHAAVRHVSQLGMCEQVRGACYLTPTARKCSHDP